MISRIPNELQPLLQDYAAGICSALPDVISGIYLQGSIALDGFIPGRSDIDFITVISRQLLEEELRELHAIHEQLKAKHSCYSVMEGQYTTSAHLSHSIQTPMIQFPKYFYGEYKGLTNGNIDSTSLWILKNHGITLHGAKPQHLLIDVDWPDLLIAMKYNLHKYWTEKAGHYESFVQDHWVDDTVLTLGRIMYTLEHKQIVTKDQGGLFLLQLVSDEWHPLIQEAIRIRRGDGSPSVFVSNKERAIQTQSFVNYMIHICNETYKLLD
ncbi:aminoglycoside adenylyltransferase domain-containing protein [Paenibacillus sp. 1_12]|uniref:aminoglycoside adenylyltransferase domain-containing protein n=1 Tax=Paenibacillus sp. 1_12 TaxID=1566278 RepID=UPI001C488749|nr:aminoglycoside adenylyltransferase domain-containing protein [Paenibacillus sp. 1_12]